MEAKIENHQIVVTVNPGDMMDGNVNIPVGGVIRKTLAKHEVEKLLGKPQVKAADMPTGSKYGQVPLKDKIS